MRQMILLVALAALAGLIVVIATDVLAIGFLLGPLVVSAVAGAVVGFGSRWVIRKSQNV